MYIGGRDVHRDVIHVVYTQNSNGSLCYLICTTIFKVVI